MPFSPTSWPGSFAGGVLNSPLEIDTPADATPPENSGLRVHVPDDNTYPLALYNDTFDSAENDPTFAIAVDNDGAVDLYAEGLAVYDSVFLISGHFHRRFQGTPLFGGTQVPTEPAAAQIQISTFSLWLDPTPGATKLMVKAKDSLGVVRTATIALA